MIPATEVSEKSQRAPQVPESLRSLNAAVVSHALVSGPTYELVEYLRTRTTSLLCILHPLQPFNPVGPQHSTCQRFQGTAVVAAHFPRMRLPRGWVSELVCFLKDALCTLVWCLRSPARLDLYIGVDPLNAWIGVLLQKMGKVRRTVYYTIDYVPKRFPQRWLNRFYHWVDACCVRRCDVVWNLAHRMVQARESAGISPAWRSKQLTVPIGTEDFTPTSLENFEAHSLVFFGGLMRKQGLQLGLEALPRIAAEYPDTLLKIIGAGVYEQELRRLIKQLSIEKHVLFLGPIEKHRTALEQVAGCAVGLAPYCEEAENFSQYTEPGKLKAYLSAGVPILMTRVPEIAPTLEAAGCAVVIPYDSQALAEAVISFFKDRERLMEYRLRALAFAARYRWSKLFDEALRHSLQENGT